MRIYTALPALACITLCLSACDADRNADPSDSKKGAQPAAAQQISAADFFEDSYQETLQRDPMTMESRGVPGVYDGWNNLSEAFARETLAIKQQQLKSLTGGLNRSELSPDEQVSYDLMEHELELAITEFEFRDHVYPVTQMYGDHITPINQLLNVHKIVDVAGAEAYIRRLEQLPKYLQQVIASLQSSAAKGIIAPKFAFEGPVQQIDGILTGKPYQADAENDSILLANFKQKTSALELDADLENRLLARAENALVVQVQPAYRALQDELSALAERAKIDGVWAMPDGERYYEHLLKAYTTTDLSPEEIHQLGLQEVDRIHREIRSIMDQLKFEGDLQAFFKLTTEDERFLYAKGEAGRIQAVADAEQLIDGFKPHLDSMFITQALTDVIVKPIEPFREATSPAAFYQPGSPDGSRPGIYYVNTYNRKELPKWQMAAITYHEALPGHHMQVSIGQEKDGLPSFRKFVYFTAHSEGWGMYSEYLPKEMGLYTNPYDDYGRLVMELLRACRLVADTGIHSKRWTEEQAIRFLMDNMAINRDRATRSVRRYFVLPGQATAYKVGMIKILELRERAIEALGDKFDLADFHEVILTNGMLPLTVLEQFVNEWIAERKSVAGEVSMLVEGEVSRPRHSGLYSQPYYL